MIFGIPSATLECEPRASHTKGSMGSDSLQQGNADLHCEVTPQLSTY
jgi:hypothetical protein